MTTLQTDLGEVLRLMELANSFNKHIDHVTWTAIRESMTGQDVQLTPAASRRFLSLLSQPNRLADLLRRLHQLRVLENIIPAMQRARSLLQFNEYHKYTVDEHTFRAVQAATDFLHDPSLVGETYRQITDKRILHLAILLHDLGKGYEADHSDVGLRIASETARDLGLTPGESDDLKFLVHRHLYMAHTAFRHDLFDEDVLLRFTREVGRMDLLRMLFVLTCADLAAVGPGVLNRWKLSLLCQLYIRTAERLGDETDDALQEETTQYATVQAQRPSEIDAAWWNRQLRSLPPSYLFHRQPGEVSELLRRVREMDSRPQAWGGIDEDARAVVYTVLTHQSTDHGAFHRLTGALSSKGHEILKADIHTLQGPLVLRCFHVNDTDHAFPPPEERLEEISKALTQVLKDASDDAPTFRRIWRQAKPSSPAMTPLPTRVRIDTSSSPRFTIITVFAYDRTGLLYDIARTLYELNLPVRFAKIGTYADQVVDVFYVTDAQGQPLRQGQLLPIRDALQRAVLNEES